MHQYVQSYISCGFTIHSEIELPELFEVKNVAEAQITIRLGETTPDSMTDGVHIKPFSRISLNEYYFEFPDVIRLMVRNGNEITVEFLTPDVRFARQFIYQNALPMAMMQQKKVLFQASGVVDKQDKVWLFFAPPRSGKTASALKLAERGYRFFSDNLVGLTLNDDDSVLATPFAPMVSLWPPVEKAQSVFTSDELIEVRRGISKKIGLLNPRNWNPEPKTVAGLIEVEHIANSMNHSPISMVEAFEVLRNAVYFNQNTVHMNMEPQLFSMLTALVKQTQLIRVTRPKLKDSYSQMAEYLDTKIISGGKNA